MFEAGWTAQGRRACLLAYAENNKLAIGSRHTWLFRSSPWCTVASSKAIGLGPSRDDSQGSTLPTDIIDGRLTVTKELQWSESLIYHDLRDCICGAWRSHALGLARDTHARDESGMVDESGAPMVEIGEIEIDWMQMCVGRRIALHHRTTWTDRMAFLKPKSQRNTVRWSSPDGRAIKKKVTSQVSLR